MRLRLRKDYAQTHPAESTHQTPSCVQQPVRGAVSKRCARSGAVERLHDLRHSWASRALALGEGLTVIGKLLGHSRMEMTARYAHLARDSAQEAAERVAESIAEDML